MRKVLPLIIGFALFVSLPSTVLSGTKEITISHGVDKVTEFVVAAYYTALLFVAVQWPVSREEKSQSLGLATAFDKCMLV